MERWKDYVNHPPIVGSDEEMAENGRRNKIKQIAMIHSIASYMKIKITEGDLQATAYYSKGSTDRDMLVAKALAAFPQIAENTSRSADAADAMIKR